MVPPGSLKDTVIPLPPEDVPPWVTNDIVGLKLEIVLSTLVVYDACKLFRCFCNGTEENLTGSTVCTFDKEVKYFWVSLRNFLVREGNE